MLHGLVRSRSGGGRGGGRGGGFVCGLSDLDAQKQNRSTGEPPQPGGETSGDRCWYLSLWPLLQPLQEGSHVVVVVNGELHVLAHDGDGNILKGDRKGPFTSLIPDSVGLKKKSL